MPPEGAVSVVSDDDDDPNLVAELNRRAGPTNGMVLVRPVPGVRGTVELASDVLIGLGKSYDALTREKQRSEAWPLVGIWLRAEQVRHLVVADADRLPASLWGALAALAAGASVHLWLVTSTAEATHDQVAAAGSADRVGGEQFIHSLPQPPAAAPDAGQVEGPLPTDDFLTFRASCRDLLTADRFEAVDRVYRLAFEETLGIANWLSTTMVFPSKGAVLEHLRRLTGTSAGPGETLIRLRAAQAAFFVKGLVVNGDPPSFDWGDVPAVALTPDVARRLRRLVSPELCAAYALVAAHRHVDPSKLRVGGVTPGGSSMVSGGVTLPLPDYGRALVEVQRLARLQAGAGPDDPLLPTPRGGAVPTDAHLRYLKKASELAGVEDPLDTLRPLWHAPGPRGFMVEVIDLLPERENKHIYWNGNDLEDAARRYIRRGKEPANGARQL